jgi:hypothetical protein
VPYFFENVAGSGLRRHFCLFAAYEWMCSPAKPQPGKIPATAGSSKEKAPCLATGRFEMFYFLVYQVLVPWHPGEQELAAAL